MKYKKGTQAMLDAAKDDATLLPFDTVFISLETLGAVVREKWELDDRYSVGMVGVEDVSHSGAYGAKSLLPAKKSKPKKWQNGTQAQLDAARDDARMIPKKTYFRSKYGRTIGKMVYVIDNKHNDCANVLMFSTADFSADFHSASDLEPIND